MLALPAPVLEAIAAHGSGLTILVVRLGAMGDIVRTLPAVRLIRFALPDARLHWVAWEPWAQLLRHQPDIDGVLGLPRSELRLLARSPLGWPSLAGTSRRFAAKLRAIGARLVVDFHADFRSGLIGLLSGARVRVGYEGHQQKEGNQLFTTHRVPSGDRRTPRLERNLDLVRAMGLPVRPVPDAGLEIPTVDADRARSLVRELAGGSTYAVLGPGASRRQSYKKPPAELFAAAAMALAERGVAPIVAAGPGEDEDADRVVAAAGGVARRAPATSLLVLAGLLREARLFVGGDTGPLHLACGVGCPVVGLYGPTDPLVNTPWNVPFVALSPPGRLYTGIKSKDRAAGGFAGLDPRSVLSAVTSLLSRER